MVTIEIRTCNLLVKNVAKLHHNPKFKGPNYNLIKDLTKFEVFIFLRKTNIERKTPQSAMSHQQSTMLDFKMCSLFEWKKPNEIGLEGCESFLSFSAL